MTFIFIKFYKKRINSQKEILLIYITVQKNTKKIK